MLTEELTNRGYAPGLINPDLGPVAGNRIAAPWEMGPRLEMRPEDLAAWVRLVETLFLLFYFTEQWESQYLASPSLTRYWKC